MRVALVAALMALAGLLAVSVLSTSDPARPLCIGRTTLRCRATRP